MAETGGEGTRQRGHADIALPPALAVDDPYPLVGRQAELSTLRSRELIAVGGRPQLVAIAGEPGVGKSRLARAFARSVHGSGAIVLYGRCDEDPIDRYAPFVQALRHGLRSVRVALPAETALIGRVAPDMEGMLPGRAGPVSDAETERFRFFEAIVAALRALATVAPVVLVADDLHWARRPVLLLLRHVLRQPPPFPLLVVATYRDTEGRRTEAVTDLLADLRREEGLVTRIDLGGLDAGATQQLVGSLVGRHAADPDLATRLVELTRGNSFFIREVCGQLSEADAAGQRDLAHALDRLGVPDGVREVVLRRIGSFPEQTQQTLSTAAVVGSEFDVGVLARLIDRTEEQIVDDLDPALDARMLEEAPGGVDRFAFSHAIVREALYSTLDPPWRASLHRVAGEVLEARAAAGVTVPLAELARHFSLASESSSKALSYARRAGDEAMRDLAYEPAAELYRAAAELVEGADGAPEELAELLLAEGAATQLASDVARAREIFRTAATLARRQGLAPRLLAEAALGFAGSWGDPGIPDPEVVALLEEALAGLDGPSGLRARLLTRLSFELCFSADGHRRAIALGTEAVAAAEVAGEPRALTEARWHARSTLGLPIAPAERASLAEASLRLAQRASDAGGALSARGWTFLEALEGGSVTEAGLAIDAYAKAIDELRMPFRHGWPLLWRATIALAEGRVDEAETIHGEAMAAMADDIVPLFVINWSAALVGIRMVQGRGSELRSAIERFANDRPGLLAWRSTLAVVCEEAGERDAARAAYGELVAPGVATIPYDIHWPLTVVELAELAARFGDDRHRRDLAALLAPWEERFVVAGYGAFCYGPVQLRLGQLAASLGELDEAEAHLAHTIERCRGIGFAPWAATAELELAAVLDARGGPTGHDRAEAVRAAVATEAEAGGWGVLRRRARAAGQPVHRAPVSPW